MKELFNRFAGSAHRKFAFSDEKLLNVEATFNSLDVRLLAKKLRNTNLGGWLVAKKAHAYSSPSSATASLTSFL